MHYLILVILIILNLCFQTVSTSTVVKENLIIWAIASKEKGRKSLITSQETYAPIALVEIRLIMLTTAKRETISFKKNTNVFLIIGCENSMLSLKHSRSYTKKTSNILKDLCLLWYLSEIKLSTNPHITPKVSTYSIFSLCRWFFLRLKIKSANTHYM